MSRDEQHHCGGWFYVRHDDPEHAGRTLCRCGLPKPPADTAARRRWVKGLEVGDEVKVCTENGVRTTYAVRLERSRRYVGSRALNADGTLRPEARAYPSHRPTTCTAWIDPFTAAEAEWRDTQAAHRRLEAALKKHAPSAAKLEALIALLEAAP